MSEPLLRRALKLGSHGWRAVVAVLGVAAGAVTVATYLWPDEPTNAAAIEATLVGYRSLADFRVATGDENGGPAPASVAGTGPLLGLHLEVVELVGYGGERLAWSWQLLRRGRMGLERVESEPSGGSEHYVTTERQDERFALVPAAIFPAREGELFVRVRLERASDDQFLAEDCSNVVVLRRGTFTDGRPVAC